MILSALWAYMGGHSNDHVMDDCIIFSFLGVFIALGVAGVYVYLALWDRKVAENANLIGLILLAVAILLSPLALGDPVSESIIIICVFSAIISVTGIILFFRAKTDPDGIPRSKKDLDVTGKVVIVFSDTQVMDLLRRQYRKYIVLSAEQFSTTVGRPVRSYIAITERSMDDTHLDEVFDRSMETIMVAMCKRYLSDQVKESNFGFVRRVIEDFDVRRPVILSSGKATRYAVGDMRDALGLGAVDAEDFTGIRGYDLIITFPIWAAKENIDLVPVSERGI